MLKTEAKNWAKISHDLRSVEDKGLAGALDNPG